MTHGEIHREFAAGRLTVREAADMVMAIRERPSRGVFVAALAVGLPMAIAVAAWVLVFLGKGAP